MTDQTQDSSASDGTSTHEQDAGPGQDDAFVGEAPAGDANPGDYMSNDQQGGTSEETGTVYDRSGEPESTPEDELRAEGGTDDEVPG